MTLRGMLGILALLAVALTGCGQQHYVNEIIRPDTGFGQPLLLLTGSGEHLVKSGHISAHRQMNMPDGTMIDVWVLKAQTEGQPKGTYLLLHGLRMSKAYHLGAAKMLSTRGYDVVLPDLRAHGRSGGKYTTYGYHEKLDVKTVMDRLLEEGMVHTPFYAFGETLGATTAIQWAAIDDRVKAVAADAPYRDFSTQAIRTLVFTAPAMSQEDIRDVIERAEKAGDFQAEQTSSVKSVRELDIPLLLMNGFLNTSVPTNHVEAIRDAAGGPVKMKVKIIDRTPGWLVEQLDKLATEGLPDATSN
ncbi:MAG: alpha/beta hydrolase [Phycisphaerae bacterium]